MLRQQVRLLIGKYKNRKNQCCVDYAEVALKAHFGKHVRIAPRTRIDAYCTVGSYTFIGFNCSITRAVIGRYVSIANNVSIGPGEHLMTKISTSSIFYSDGFDELTLEPVSIGNDVWIGVDSIVRRGVTIADGAVVGANSFVSHDVPPFAVVAGSPARIIKYRFSPEQQARILESRWWDKDVEEARLIIRGLEEEFAAPGRAAP